MTLLIRAPRWGDVVSISRRMRDIDRLECRAAGHAPKHALVEAWRGSGDLCWTAEVDGRAEAMFGATPGPVMEGIGYPWLLGTDAAREQRRAFASEAGAYVDRLRRRYPRMENLVAVENTASIRWLKRQGFRLDDEHHIRNGIAMVRFSMGF